MAKILSQEEIDELLNMLDSKLNLDDPLVKERRDAMLEKIASGEIDTIESQRESPRIQIYDFRRPDRFTKDAIQVIGSINETFARLTGMYLGNALNVPVALHVASVDQLTYEEFIRSIPQISVLGIYSMEPLRQAILMEIDLPLSRCMIVQSQGHKIEANQDMRQLDKDVDEEDNKFSETDIEIMKSIMETMTRFLREAWMPIHEIHPGLTGLKTDTHTTQIVPPNDLVLLVTFMLSIGDVEGMMNICIPYLTLDTIIDNLTMDYYFSSIKDKNSPRIRPDFDVDVSVSLHGGSLTLEVLERLRKGSLLPIKGIYRGMAGVQLLYQDAELSSNTIPVNDLSDSFAFIVSRDPSLMDDPVSSSHERMEKAVEIGQGIVLPDHEPKSKKSIIMKIFGRSCRQRAVARR